jgi:hypothetical protein
VIEKSAVEALRLGDVRKALRIINDAPLAPKNDATFKELQKLHPSGKPSPQPQFVTPTFRSELVKTALASFSTGSSAGLFGYRPFLLQQCAKAESFAFLPLLQPLLISWLVERLHCFFNHSWLEASLLLCKSPTKEYALYAVATLIEGWWANAFVLVGKTRFQKNLRIKTSVSDVLVASKLLLNSLQVPAKSGMALLKSDFRNAFNLIYLEVFVKAAFPGLSQWTHGGAASHSVKRGSLSKNE